MIRSLPKISQATLADIVGATRSRVSFFLNKFRKLGLIQSLADVCPWVHRLILTRYRRGGRLDALIVVLFHGSHTRRSDAGMRR